MITTLLLALALSLTINTSLFLIAYKLKSDKLTDISYALSFMLIAVFGFLRSNDRTDHIVLTLLVLVWGVRIGGFLLYRVMKTGKDQRFDGIRESFVKFGKFWLGQAVAVWVLMIPAVFAFSGPHTSSWVSIVGVTLWAIGLLSETVADAQKFAFSSKPENKGKWIESGIWKYSRHPNYFGEILVWIGIYLYVVPSMTTSQSIIGIISPVFISLLLLFVSGIPILEKSADEKWGQLAAYKAYKARTSILIPLPNKK